MNSPEGGPKGGPKKSLKQSVMDFLASIGLTPKREEPLVPLTPEQRTRYMDLVNEIDAAGKRMEAELDPQSHELILSIDLDTDLPQIQEIQSRFETLYGMEGLYFQIKAVHPDSRKTIDLTSGKPSEAEELNDIHYICLGVFTDKNLTEPGGPEAVDLVVEALREKRLLVLMRGDTRDK